MNDDDFLAEILAHPDDDGPRLIYADWLEERGDPRAALIRVQIALSQLPAEDAHRRKLELQEKKLLKNPQVARPLKIGIPFLKYEYRRGFIEQIQLSIEHFLEHGEEVYSVHPIRTVRFLPVNALPSVEPLLRSPLLSRISTLSFRPAGYDGQLRRPGFNDVCVQALVASPNVPFLKGLEIPGNQLTDASASTLGSCAALNSLTHLDLSNNTFSADGLQILLHAKTLGRLESLSLSRSVGGAPAGEVLGQAPQHLRSLNVSSCNLGTRGLQALCRGRFPHLTRLDLSGTRIGSLGGKALANAPFLGQLPALRLSRNRFEDKGVADLLASGTLSNLRVLDLRRNRLTSAAALAIANTPSLGSLVELDLRNNRIDAAGVLALAQSPHLTNLKRVDLRDNDFSDQEAARLRETIGPRFARLATSKPRW